MLETALLSLAVSLTPQQGPADLRFFGSTITIPKECTGWMKGAHDTTIGEIRCGTSGFEIMAFGGDKMTDACESGGLAAGATVSQQSRFVLRDGVPISVCVERQRGERSQILVDVGNGFVTFRARPRTADETALLLAIASSYRRGRAE
jgi:hypothetical protein